jgi:hypothetical protein
MLLSDVSKNLCVVPPGVFFLSFPEWYVVGDAADSSVNFGILFSYFDRNTYWHRRDAARPIELDMPCANILVGFLDGISRIPSRFRSNAKTRDQGEYENVEDFHLSDEKISYSAEKRGFLPAEVNP